VARPGTAVFTGIDLGRVLTSDEISPTAGRVVRTSIFEPPDRSHLLQDCENLVRKLEIVNQRLYGLVTMKGKVKRILFLENQGTRFSRNV
jgi:hypothetical protein